MTYTYYTYEVLPVGGTSLFKVIRYKRQRTSNNNEGVLLSSSTVLKRVGKNVADEYAFLKNRNK